MEIQNKIGEQVFDKLRSKFKKITLGDAEGNATQDPQEAVFFNFNYIDEEGHDHGNITVSLIDRTMKIYYSKNISKDLKGSELSEWYEFLQDMRKTAKSNLYGFDTHDISKSALDIQDINATVNRNDVAEGKMYGSKKRSYQECGPAKIIVRHTENINAEVRGARSRKVESVFVETAEGERFLMPFKNLPGTRAMAQHIGQGGRPYDEIGESISLMVNEIASLRPFVSRNRNAIYEDETTMQMVEAAREYYAETRKTLGKLKGKRGYKAYAESFTVTEQDLFGDDDASSMKDRFTKKRFSDKMEAAMPVVRKAYNLKNMKPNTPHMKPVKPIVEFEEWAEEVTEMPGPKITKFPAGGFNEYNQTQMGLSNHDMQVIKGIIQGSVEMDDFPEVIEKLMDYYIISGEMPYGTAKARDGDPYTWIEDQLHQDFPDFASSHLREEEEMCSTECCGKPVSKCHCGPECPHCDCHEKNKKLDEVKSGNMKNSKAVGKRVKIQGSDDNGSNEHDGKEGTISRATREHTFSQMVPFKVIYGVELDDGGKISIRRENTRILKNQSAPVTEETLQEDGILQGLFNFMWNMTNMIPSIAAKRETKRLGHEFSRFKEKMTDEAVDKWMDELAAKLTSTHSNTMKAKVGRLETLRKIIQKVKIADSEKRFVGIMQKLRGELRQWEKFVVSSNKGVQYRKKKKKTKATAARRTAADNKLANWVKKGGNELNEGTWAIPDTPDKQERLRDLMASPLLAGVDGENATAALYDLIGDDRLFDELYTIGHKDGPETDTRPVVLHFLQQIIMDVSGEREGQPDDVDWGNLQDLGDGLDEGLNEGSQLTDNVTATLINRLEKKFPDVFKRHGAEYIYDLVREEVSWLTDDWPEDEGFGSSDSFGPWKNVLSQLGIDINGRGDVINNSEATQWQPVNEYGSEEQQAAGVTSNKNQAIQFLVKNAMINVGPNVNAEEDYNAGGVYMVTGIMDDRGEPTRAIVYMPGTQMGGEHGDFELEENLREDVILPKATYSDYLEVYKSSDIGGTDTDDDAKRMVKSLEKKGKTANVNAAKGALKRMAEAKAKEGLHIHESLNDLRRQAGIIK